MATAAGMRFRASADGRNLRRSTTGMPSFLAITLCTTSISTTPMSARIWPSVMLRSRASMASASSSSAGVRKPSSTRVSPSFCTGCARCALSAAASCSCETIWFAVRYSPSLRERISFCFSSAWVMLPGEAASCSTSSSPSGLPMRLSRAACVGTNQRTTPWSAVCATNRNRPQSACTCPTVSPSSRPPSASVTENGWCSDGACNPAPSGSVCTSSRTASSSCSVSSPENAMVTALLPSSGRNFRISCSGRKFCSRPAALPPSVKVSRHGSPSCGGPPWYS